MAEEKKIDNVQFVCFGRTTDNIMLHTWSADAQGPAPHDQRMGTVKKLLQASKKRMTAGQRQKLAWENNQVYCMLDPGDGTICYVVITTGTEYPERLAYQLLTDLMQYAERFYAQELVHETKPDGLGADLATYTATLARKYDDPDEFDKIQKAIAKTAAIKQAMNENIVNLAKNTEDLGFVQE